MMKRFATLAAFTVAALSFAGQANAAYTLTLANPNPTSIVFGGTSFQFQSAATPQTSVGNFGQAFNVINVGNLQQTGADSGQMALSVDFTITGSGATPGLLNGRLT